MSGTKFRVKKCEIHQDSAGVKYEIGAEINQDFPIEAPEGSSGKLLVNNDLEVTENTTLTGDLTVGAQGSLSNVSIHGSSVGITGNVTINAEEQLKVIVDESAAPNQEYFSVVSHDGSTERMLIGCFGNISGNRQVWIPSTAENFNVDADTSIDGTLMVKEIDNFSGDVINLSGECEATNLKANSIAPINSTGGFTINSADSLTLEDTRTAQRAINYEVSMVPTTGEVTQRAGSDLAGGTIDFLVFDTTAQKIETGANAFLNLTNGTQGTEHTIDHLTGEFWTCAELNSLSTVYSPKYTSPASQTTTIEAPTTKRVDIKSDSSIRLESDDVVIFADADNEGPRLHLHTDDTGNTLAQSPALQLSESTNESHSFGSAGVYGFDFIYHGQNNVLDITSYNGSTQQNLHMRMHRDTITTSVSNSTYSTTVPNTSSAITGSLVEMYSMLKLNPSKVGQKSWPSGAGSNDYIVPLLMDENGFIYGGDVEYSQNQYLQNFTGAHSYASSSAIPVGSSVILTPNKEVEASSTSQSKICCGIVAACLQANSHSKRDMQLSSGVKESSLPEGHYICIVLAVGDSTENECPGFNVCNENGDIQPGDLLVTSSTPGYLMKQDDDIIRSCTVGKAMESVVFNDQGQASGVYGYLYCG